MVWFTFTFLLGIPNNLVQQNIQQNSTKKKEVKLEVEKNYTETEVSKPNFSCHIEYVLFPNDPPKYIDVVCWEKAAKIYFENSTSAITPLAIKKLRWIHFRVNHKMKLKTVEIPIFHMHKMKFTVSLGSKNFGEAAKSDKTKKFYGPKFPDEGEDYFIQKQIFQPLSETLEDLQSVSFFKEHLSLHQQLYISLDTTIETSENFIKLYKTLLNLTNEYHDDNFIQTPTPPYQEIPPLVPLSKVQSNHEAVNGKEKKGKTETQKKGAANDQLEFSITGEDFLAGSKTFENCLKYNSAELPYIFCLAAVKNLLSKAQAEFFNPLSLKLSHLNYVPVDELKKQGITKLKFQYLVCNEFLAESNVIPISDKMTLNYTRTILTNTIDRTQLMYFIQTGGLKIDVIGILEDKLTPEPKIYSPHLINTKANLLKNNECSKSTLSNKFVLLGTADVDISCIIFQPHKVHLKLNFKIPADNIVAVMRRNHSNFTTVNEFNLCCSKRKDLNFWQYFNSSSPVLTVEARLSCPLTKIYKTVAVDPNLFNRLFMVLYDKNLTVSFLHFIQYKINEFLWLVDYTKNGVNVKRPLSRKNLESMSSYDYSTRYHMTGFWIDCTDKILIYVESSVFGDIQQVWALASCVDLLQGHVLYDSSLIFPGRLYESFFKYGGFFTITLKESPEVILSKPEICGNENIPAPAWKALTCLNLLIDCKSIKTATRNNLFPDSDCLSSLAIELGVPVQIYEKTERLR